MRLHQCLAAAFACAAGFIASLALPAAAQAPAWPAKPITVVISFPAGGNNDVRTRQLAVPVGRALGQPLVVDNRPGANGNIGHAYVAHAAADGYTLGIGTLGPMVVNRYVYPRLGFDPAQDFVPVVLIENTPMVLVTNTAKPFQSLKDLVDAARARPGSLNIGNAGQGGPAHLGAMLLARTANISMVNVPYKGGGPASLALRSGEIDVLFELPSAVLPSLKAGLSRALAVTSAQRLPALPDVPTMAELGYPQVLVSNWMGLMAPRGTPPEVVARLNQSFTEAMAQPAFRDSVSGSGNVVGGGSAADFAAFLAQEQARWEPIVKAANIHLD
jgi:tripartite-type tricarboxylate transporter receptor subunit TctC